MCHPGERNSQELEGLHILFTSCFTICTNRTISHYLYKVLVFKLEHVTLSYRHTEALFPVYNNVIVY